MKLAPNKLFQFIAPAAMLVTLSIAIQAQGTQQQQNAGDATVTQTQTQADQMLGPLNLTQDQIQKIRSINADLREERQAAGMRLRLAQRALTEAIQSPTPDETLISQRSKEVADAQANTIRLRSLTEARILQVLTPEQRVKLRELRQQANLRRNQNQQQFPRGLQRRQNALQRNQNPNALTRDNSDDLCSNNRSESLSRFRGPLFRPTQAGGSAFSMPISGQMLDASSFVCAL